LLLFFSSLSVPLLDLHSFPTRRSSDLRPLNRASRSTFNFRTFLWIRVVLCLVASAAAIAQPAEPSVLERYYREARTALAEKRLRSEEHTSELQSRRDLVCRLLLEKKKK